MKATMIGCLVVLGVLASTMPATASAQDGDPEAELEGRQVVLARRGLESVVRRSEELRPHAGGERQLERARARMDGRPPEGGVRIGPRAFFGEVRSGRVWFRGRGARGRGTASFEHGEERPQLLVLGRVVAEKPIVGVAAFGPIVLEV